MTELEMNIPPHIIDTISRSIDSGFNHFMNDLLSGELDDFIQFFIKEIASIDEDISPSDSVQSIRQKLYDNDFLLEESLLLIAGIFRRVDMRPFYERILDFTDEIEKKSVNFIPRTIGSISTSYRFAALLERFNAYIAQADIENIEDIQDEACEYFASLFANINIRSNPETMLLVQRAAEQCTVFASVPPHRYMPFPVDSYFQKWRVGLEEENLPSLSIPDYFDQALDIIDFMNDISDKSNITAINTARDLINRFQYWVLNQEIEDSNRSLNNFSLSKNTKAQLRKQTINFLERYFFSLFYTADNQDFVSPYTSTYNNTKYTLTPIIYTIYDTNFDLRKILLSKATKQEKIQLCLNEIKSHDFFSQPEKQFRGVAEQLLDNPSLFYYLLESGEFDNLLSILSEKYPTDIGTHGTIKEAMLSDLQYILDFIENILKEIRSLDRPLYEKLIDVSYAIERNQGDYINIDYSLIINDGIQATAAPDSNLEVLVVDDKQLSVDPIQVIIDNEIKITEADTEEDDNSRLGLSGAIKLVFEPNTSVTTIIEQKMLQASSLPDYLAWSYIQSYESLLKTMLTADADWSQLISSTDEPYSVFRAVGLGQNHEYWRLKSLAVENMISRLVVQSDNQMHYIVQNAGKYDYIGVIYIPENNGEPALWRFGFTNTCMRVGIRSHMNSLGQIVSLPITNSNQIMHEHISPYFSVAGSQNYDDAGNHIGNKETHVSSDNAPYFVAAGLLGVYQGEPTLSLNSWIKKHYM